MEDPVGFSALSVRTTLQSCLCSTSDSRSFHMRLALSTFSVLSQSFSALAHWLHPSRDTHSGNAALPLPARTASVCREGLSSGALSGTSAQLKPSLRHSASAGGSAPRSHITHCLQSAASGTFGPSASIRRNARRPVRVLHPAARSEVGRMVIAGRMADVCAELERMAACDTWHH